jgi:GNAT superfamily N-acetyltransferase
VGIRIDPVSGEEDARRWLERRNRVALEPLPEDQRTRLRELQPDTIELLARLDDRLVAAAFVGSPIYDPRAPHAGCSAYVLPEERGHGVGQALYVDLSERARSLGKDELEATAAASDEASIGFLRRRGFREVTRSQQASLELADADVPEPASRDVSGFELVPLAERPELAAGMYDVALEAIPDIPVAEPVAVGSEAEWREDELAHARLDLSVVAVAGDVVVGYSTLGDFGEGIALHLMTGVRRAWRGRGVARALKLVQIAAARRAGLQRLVAYNDATNAPMQGLNVALGYRLHPVYVTLRGPLAGGAEAAGSSRTG